MTTELKTDSDLINPLESHIGYQLRRASTLVMAVLADRLSTTHLTITEASVLVMINYNPGISQSAIGRSLGVKRANMAPIIATLDDRGLVLRSNPNGRLVSLSTTEAGRQSSNMIEAMMRANDNEMFGSLEAQSQLDLLNWLTALRRSRV